MEGISFGIHGAVAVVTGAGSRGEGIGNGRAAAIMLARAGAHVALVDIVEEAAVRTRDLIAREDGMAHVVVGDVSDPGAARRIAADVEERLGPPTILVNNTGIAGPPGTAVDVDPDAWDAAMQVNVKSMMLMSGAVVPAMEAAGGGAIVNLSSAAGLRAGHPALLYATTKGAVVNLTRTMAGHHGPAGIRVNCVAPGMVHTPMVTSRGMTPELRRRRRERSLLQTEGTGWDVGAAVLFLASDLARWITGVVLPVDAGYSAGSLPLPTPPRH